MTPDPPARTAGTARRATCTQAQLDDLTAAATPDQDPALLDELPYLAGKLADAPADLLEALIGALDIQALYRPEQDQATIWAILTDTTPATITALLNDPRVTASQPTPQPPAQVGTRAPNAELAQGPIAPHTVHDHGPRGGVAAGRDGRGSRSGGRMPGRSLRA